VVVVVEDGEATKSQALAKVRMSGAAAATRSAEKGSVGAGGNQGSPGRPQRFHDWWITLLPYLLPHEHVRMLFSLLHTWTEVQGACAVDSGSNWYVVL